MINGKSLIGTREIVGKDLFRAMDARTGELLEPQFGGVGNTEVNAACALAASAFDQFRNLDPAVRADFLDAIGEEIIAIGDALIDRAVQESGLTPQRLIGERGRTVGQLKMFAAILREGHWLRLVVERALPERQPIPRPDLRQRRIALGPVAVFGASNFPLAFSVAGGDTASALAAGCPVVAKGHPAHPGTSELVGRAIRAAATRCQMPEGVFSLLQGTSTALGSALVADPRIKAVGFTGSRGGGLALAAVAAARPEPIPVYAEMSSINPVVLFPGALSERAEQLAKDFVASLTLGAGQFCTNPGLILGIRGDGLAQFAKAVHAALATQPASVMLTSDILQQYKNKVASRGKLATAKVVGRGQPGDDRTGQAVVFEVDAADCLANPIWQEEVFGASAVIVRCDDMSQYKQLLEAIEGQLTVTIQIAVTDEPDVAPLIPIMERKAGRILANSWPTGVDVGRAMVHGGPFPATSDNRSTSVGADAIERFLRPVCYQNLPDNLLPAALQETNPLGLPRQRY